MFKDLPDDQLLKVTRSAIEGNNTCLTLIASKREIHSSVMTGNFWRMMPYIEEQITREVIAYEAGRLGFLLRWRSL